MKFPTGKQLSNLVVGVVMLAALLGFIWLVLPVTLAAICSLLLGYEAYTLANQFPGDTLSESIWRLNKRPLVPFLFGVGVGVAMALGYIDHPAVATGVGLLCGHFFWQRGDACQPEPVHPAKEA